MRLLLLLAFPESVRAEYREGLRQLFPELEIVDVDHHSKAGPYLAETEILVTFGAHLSDHVLEQAPRLRWIQALGTGVDGIVDRPLRAGVLVTNLRGLHGATVSEAVIAAMLALSRDLPRASRNQAARRWERYPSTLLHGRTVGVVGVGAIAEQLAPRCRALGMRVIGFSATPRNIEGFDEVLPREHLTSTVAEVDHLVLLVPYSQETRHLVGQEVLAGMKETAFLINVARGGVVDEEALLGALRANRIAGAALDVFAEEPLPAEHPFWSMPNVIITPHLAGFHVEYAAEALPVVAHNIRCFLAGEIDQMKNIVRR